MAIFTNNNIFDTEIIACEGYDVELGGNYDAIMESYEDDLAVIEAMHAFDMAELTLTQESADFTEFQPTLEGNLKDIWAKIKAFFVNLGKKIMAFFRSIGDFIASIVMSGTDFAKKYAERLNKLNLSGFSYDMYDYKIPGITEANDLAKGYEDNIKKVEIDITNINKLKISDVGGAGESKFEALMNAANDEHVKLLDDYRKTLSGESDAEKYGEALYKRFRGGSVKKRFTLTSVSKYVKALEASKGLLDAIKKTEKSVKDSFKKVETLINTAASEADKIASESSGNAAKLAARKAAIMRKNLTTYSAMMTVLTRFLNAWSTAVKESTGVYKNLCFKALQHKNAK